MRLKVNEFSLLFLLIPMIIFIPCWFNLMVAIPSLIAIFAALFLFFKEENKNDNCVIINIKNWKDILFIVISICILTITCIFAGFGGFISTTDDWRKHHYIIDQLSRNSWPVTASSKGKTGYMSYYLGSYIFPALIGKLTGSTVASDIALFITGLIGLSLCVLLMFGFGSGKKNSHLVLISVIIMTFTTFIVPAKIMLSTYAPDDFIGGFLWFTSHANVVYSSNFTQLRWAFAQAIPGWICTLLLLNFRERRSHWLLILLSSVFYSVFVSIGLISIMLMLFVYDVIKGKIKLFFRLENGLIIIPGLLFFTYYLALFIQPKDSLSGMDFGLINWNGHIITFILILLLWIPFLFILRKCIEKDVLICASIYLILISFVNMGTFNDLCLRSTIPSMMIFSALLVKLIISSKTKLLTRIILVGMMVLLFIPDGGADMIRSSQDGFSRKNRAEAFEDVDTFAKERGDFILYQYYNWDTDGIIKYIIRK